MMKHKPDCFAIVKMNIDGDIRYRVAASWYGGYGGSDSWKLSSRINDFQENDESVIFKNESGSYYEGHKDSEGMSSLMSSIVVGAQKESIGTKTTIEILTFEQFKKEFNESN